MKIAQHVLRRFIEVPEDPDALRELLDDIGIEVKRTGSGEHGAVYNVELLANRGDHYCYEGIAREIRGRTGGRLRRPRWTTLDIGASPVPLRNETEQCLVYTATLLERVDEAERLPGEKLAPLLAADIHSVSPPVDATNLSNLELGQPTHAFDADRIEGALTIRLSRAGETAWPLFTEERVELPEGTLVIADDAKILAIAGVIGCEDSKATDETKRLLLESATFDPVAVRKAKRALDIHTDSAARFERGADPTMPLVGAGRVVHLLEKYGGWQRRGATGRVGDWENPGRILPLDIPAAANFLEHPLTEEEVRDRLQRYGFAVSPTWPDWNAEEGWSTPEALSETSRERLRNTVLVRVPPHRLWDVEFTADLREELAKSIGYNETPAHLPMVDMGAPPTHAEAVQHRVEDVLVGLGFYEVFTDGFYGRDLRDRFGIEARHPLFGHVETLNALDRGYSLLKNNALFQAVEAVAANLRMRHEQVKAFELTRTFHPDPEASNGVCRERRLLWGIVNGRDRDPSWTDVSRPADPLYVKGVIRELAVALGIDLRVVHPSPDAPLYDLLHPNRQAAVTFEGEQVGLFGELHPAVVQEFKLDPARPVYFELSLDVLETPGAEVAFEPPSERHPIVRNLAFTLPRHVTAGAVAETLIDAGPAFLDEVQMVDVYEHEEQGEAVRTITYELIYEPGEAQRTADEVNQASEYLIKAVESKFGDRGVKLR